MWKSPRARLGSFKPRCHSKHSASSIGPCLSFRQDRQVVTATTPLLYSCALPYLTLIIAQPPAQQSLPLHPSIFVSFPNKRPPQTMAATQTNGHGDGHVSGVFGYAQRSFDRIAPPSSRQKAYDDVSVFAASRPILFALLVSLLLFSLLPLLLFTTFAISTTATALAAAVLFSLFWIAVATAVLVPALLLACSAALLVWVWVVGGFLAARWLYHRVPFAVVDADGRGGDSDEIWGKRIVAKEQPRVDSDVKDVKQEN
ncbi:hypothetical protein HJFPF1_07735 [Paramyrothecium foliicola]|nr:hypothetical protein HJFPF1_07735 [Paramyrothecium foliicola]